MRASALMTEKKKKTKKKTEIVTKSEHTLTRLRGMRPTQNPLHQKNSDSYACHYRSTKGSLPDGRLSWLGRI